MVNILAGVILVWLVILAIAVPIFWLSTKLPTFGSREAAALREIGKDKGKERFKAIRAETGGWDLETFPYIPALAMALIVFGTVWGIVGDAMTYYGFAPVADKHVDHVAIDRAIPKLVPLVDQASNHRGLDFSCRSSTPAPYCTWRPEIFVSR